MYINGYTIIIQKEIVSINNIRLRAYSMFKSIMKRLKAKQNCSLTGEIVRVVCVCVCVYVYVCVCYICTYVHIE